MQSIKQSRRVAEATAVSAQLHRRKFEPPKGAQQLMVRGTSISLWRCLSQVDSQTDSFIYIVQHALIEASMKIWLAILAQCFFVILPHCPTNLQDQDQDQDHDQNLQASSN